MAKNKRHYKEEKQNYKAYFEGETGIFIIENLTRDIIERCKLPEAIELRKKLGYNHDDIMIREETSIAEKIIKLFPKENIVLNKKFNNRKPDIWFKNYNFIIEVDEGNHENYDSDDEKEREDMFKKHNFKTIRCNPNDPNFSDKIKKIKTICQKHFTKLQKTKSIQSKIKLIKIRKQPGTTHCFGCKDYTQNFRPQEVKTTNKVPREKSNVLFVDQISQGF